MRGIGSNNNKSLNIYARIEIYFCKFFFRILIDDDDDDNEKKTYWI